MDWYVKGAVIVVFVLGAANGQARASERSLSEGSSQESSSTKISSGFYTLEQAKRGHLLFNTHCLACHSYDTASAERAVELGRGFWLGERRVAMNLGGRRAHLFPTVYHFYRRIRDSMPAWGADSVGINDKVDIVAFLLQQNGFSSGKFPLSSDVVAMKTMRLREENFEPLFNGKDFTNFEFLLGPNCKPAPLGCGKSDPSPVFSVENGEIVNTGKIQGYMYTEQKYWNFTLRFDYRYELPEDWEGDDSEFDGNTGYFLFVNDHQVFPKCIEVQGGNRNVLLPFGIDAVVEGTQDNELRLKVIKPVGEWNSIEIIHQDGEIKASLNGVLIAGVAKGGHEFTEAGHIGFQSEGARIRWRNIRIKPE